MSIKLDDILLELMQQGIEISEEAIVTEPEYSFNLLIDLEKMHKTNTSTVISVSDHLFLNKEIIKEWIYLYERFIDFGGNSKQLNTVNIPTENKETHILIIQAKRNTSVSDRQIKKTGGFINPPLFCK